MRYLLIALAGFLVGTALIAAVAFAAPNHSSVRAGMPMAGAASGGMMSTVAAPAATKLTIQHARKGCHVWSDGTTTAAMMSLRLKTGQELSIIDMDVDAHQMMEFAGPARLRMGGPMMMSNSRTISFPAKGVYRIGTKTVETPGAMDVKTVGPDNRLRLVVTVA